MFRKYILPVIALLGIGLGIMAALKSAQKLVPPPMVADAPVSPYKTFVAGAGLVEANTENIAIGTEIAGIVSKIYVTKGSQVRQGDPLFTIDDRATRALLDQQQAAVKVAQSQLEQEKYTNDLNQQLLKKYVSAKAEADMSQLQVAIDEDQVRLAQSAADQTRTNLEIMTVRAPCDGQVMQLNIHPGEYAAAGPSTNPLILFGNTQPLYVRVDVDENEAWRVRNDAKAVGFLRGNKEISAPLKFVQFEPYVIPKISLTGQPTERVDTRVLQVIYSLPPGQESIRAGQQMDVFVEASSPSTQSTNQSPPFEQSMKPVFQGGPTPQHP
jgi:RND family efflux transporter MFP subunit